MNIILYSPKLNEIIVCVGYLKQPGHTKVYWEHQMGQTIILDRLFEGFDFVFVGYL